MAGVEGRCSNCVQCLPHELILVEALCIASAETAQLVDAPCDGNTKGESALQDCRCAVVVLMKGQRSVQALCSANLSQTHHKQRENSCQKALANTQHQQPCC